MRELNSCRNAQSISTQQHILLAQSCLKIMLLALYKQAEMWYSGNGMSQMLKPTRQSRLCGPLARGARNRERLKGSQSEARDVRFVLTVNSSLDSFE